MDLTLNVTTAPIARKKEKKIEPKQKVKGNKSVPNKIQKSDNVQSNESNNAQRSIIEQFKQKGFPLFDRRSSSKKISDTQVTPSTEFVFAQSGKTFKDLNIHPHTIVNLERIGKSTLTAVQEITIPVMLSGKNAFVRSQTGSGKTLAYAVPIIESLRMIEPHITRADGVQAVVVVPTRELALQTYELFLKLVEPFRWIVPGKLCGGEKRSAEKARIRKGISVLVGTPGRLLDHMQHTQNLKLNNVRCLVLDEADRLLDMGFEKDINRLVQLIDEAKSYDPLTLMKSTIKKLQENNNTKQTVLLSATLTNNVKDLASFAMDDYVYIDPINADIENLSSDVVVPECVEQQYVVTDVKAKLVVLSAFIVAKAQKESCKIFVFMASRQMVEYHEALFNKCLLRRPAKEGEHAGNVVIDIGNEDLDDGVVDVLDVEVFKLHGSMDQKERVEVFKTFRSANKAVLLCTDVAARGVDIPEADYVIQYTGPLQDEDYIHRVGRTGRAGHRGEALLFLTEPELEFVNHLNDKRLNLKRSNQEAMLRDLMPYMSHLSPAGPQMAAEALQRRYEKAVANNRQLKRAACFAYSSWSRFYSSCSVSMKQYFVFKQAHLGHYVTSFALRQSPQEVGQFVRTEAGKMVEKKLNKKLSNYEEPQDIQQKKPTKRSRGQDLVISEFDSGLEPIKKKNKNK